ncbi:MAG: sulfite exporter TauE/SafE family protein [Crocosphaera sp.]
MSISKRTVIVSIALIVWTAWLTILGPFSAFSYLLNHWESSLTMTVGSMIAGGTSMGGGAVAFPVFTKVLKVPPHDAKVFSLAIQSIGMSAAALTICLTGIKVEWKVIRWGSLGGVLGIFLGLRFLAPLLPPDIIKMSFTMMVTSFGLTLMALNRGVRNYYFAMPVWRNRERGILILAGFLGGLMSGLVGSGIDIFTFSVMVVLFHLCETVATPTSVIMMAINAVTGFCLQVFVLNDFSEPVVSYWFAAIPVVVIGAPLGAILCSLMQRQTIANIVLALISIEVTTSLALIPLTPITVYASLIALVVFSALNYLMYRNPAIRNY